MTNRFYSADFAGVDPIFFAVVPDSFMTREGTGTAARAGHLIAHDWSEIVDVPLVGSKDRWSF